MLPHVLVVWHWNPWKIALCSLAAPLAAPVATPSESAQDPITITAVHLQVGDREITVEGRNNTVVFEPGEQLNVTAIDYAVYVLEANELEGIIAFEGYLRQAQPDTTEGSYDYLDGRFRDRMNEDPISDGSYQHGGLEGGWKLVDGHNRLSLALVRYFGDSWEAENRYIVNLQAGDADLRFGGAYYKRVDDGILSGAVVSNKGTATVSTYSEIDVYDADDLTTPIWGVV